MTGYLNTIFIVVVGVAINVLLTAMTAYALSRNDVMHRRPIILFIIFTMYFGGGLIPFFLTVKGLGLNNNLFALILPGAISVFNFLILRTSFESVPPSLEESAKMDGANDFTILFRIFLPLMAPFIAVIALYYGVAHWNAWFNALLFIQDRELYPLQLILREILLISQSNNSAAGDVITSDNSYETIKYALIVVGTLPILMVYPFLQKYFVKGAMIGAVKG